MDFSIRLKELRESKGLSQAALADALGVGVSTVGMWESTKRIPGAKTLNRLITFFDCPLDYLLGHTDELGVVVMPGAVQLTDEEEELLRLFRKLPAEYRIHELESLRMFAGEPMKPALPKKA